ncbi:glycosyltransferase family 4 protein [Mesoflavibacter zeaxanthinifaciens]|uniref:glycosyltransferase family 4 protein n=1 Tax=Mesoflavibacter zeaxanthinifaciens TaxID=393060 RepID=UPI003A94B1D5
MKVKIIRTSTIALSLDVLLKGQLAFLNKHYNIVAVSGQDIHLETVLEREKVKTIAVEMQRNISPIKDLISLVRLYIVFKNEQPSIVHSITPKAGLLTMLAGRLAGVPIRIHTFTGLIFPSKTGFLQKLLINMDRLLCWAATTIIPEGNGVKEDLRAYKITKKPLKVLANGNVNGINTAHFNPTRFTTEQKQRLREALNIQEKDFVFIFVGRLVADKGINELVKAFKLISADNKNIRLLLVGPLETELDPLEQETLQEIETNPNIVAVGYQNDVRPYFAISNALVFPSYREGFPNVVMQAGAMGLPAIVSNINGCNEIIKDRENGVIIPVKNTAAIEEVMSQFLEDTEFVSELKLKARPLIVERYEQSKVWSALLDEYNHLLKEVNS